MDRGSLAERLARYLPLEDSERRALDVLQEGERAVTRGTVLCGEQSPARELFVVQRGWLYSSMLLPEGNRQILSLHLRGDLAGDTALPWVRAPFTLTAATDAVVQTIDRAAVRNLFATKPRLAMLIHLLAQAERVALADRLASVGRTSAKSRVGALILDAHCRLRTVGETIENGFVLPLTQEEIGDATGLTAVHVNRMMRQLVEEGLIARTGSRIRVVDEARLATVGNYTDRLAVIDVSGLPPPPSA